jgi:hypothetical protein
MKINWTKIGKSMLAKQKSRKGGRPISGWKIQRVQSTALTPDIAIRILERRERAYR